ncbi:vWA domain-containing protein [Microbacterium sp. YY-01]|uniref:vWA domain-containing protein n=1 Tax=Microbacterium sp. YY-01 TaxID=3421634 RepID=UPI003D17813A
MIFQPILPLFVIVLVGAALIAVTVIMLVRSPGQRPLWAVRTAIAVATVGLLLRPGIPGGELQTLATDVDVVIAIDTTASIVAEDWGEGEPRLEGVRDDVRAIVAQYPGARFALVTFDASAQLRLPLTTDTTALISAVDVLTPEVTANSQGSSIGIAHSVVADTVSRAADAAPERARMVFYLGDGEQTVSKSPESFERSAQHISGGAVLGYGTAEGGRMAVTSGRWGSDDEYIQYEGADALSTIDEDNLRAIAEQLGVDYEHRSAANPIELPEAPTTTTAYRDAGTTGAIDDVSWILALVIVVLVGVEVAAAAARIFRMRQLAAPTTRSGSHASEGVS